MEACQWPTRTAHSQVPTYRSRSCTHLHLKTAQVPCSMAFHSLAWSDLPLAWSSRSASLTGQSHIVWECYTHSWAHWKAWDPRIWCYWRGDNTSPVQDHDRTSWWSLLVASYPTRWVETDRLQRSIRKWSRDDFWFRTSYKTLRYACSSGYGRFLPHSALSSSYSFQSTSRPRNLSISSFDPRNRMINNFSFL